MRGVLCVSGVVFLSGTVVSIISDTRFLIFSAVVLVWIGFVLFFARNPRRSVPEEDTAVVAPADGRITEILQGETVRIRIFLSLFDVHVNRIPVQGEVEEIAYQTGVFLPAFLSGAGRRNERNTIWLRTRFGSVQISQIAGLVARRIVCRLRTGQVVRKGEPFGMIRFGSAVELHLPAAVRLFVRKGQRVRAGETVIGDFGHAS